MPDNGSPGIASTVATSPPNITSPQPDHVEVGPLPPLPVNPLNPSGRTIIYPVDYLLSLRQSSLCRAPANLSVPDISAPKQKSHSFSSSNYTSLNRVDGAFTQPSRTQENSHGHRLYSATRGENARNSRSLNEQGSSQTYTRPNRTRNYESNGTGRNSFSNPNGSNGTSMNNTRGTSGTGEVAGNRAPNKHRAHSNENENRDLLDKFELLGRERRGDAISSYKAREESPSLETDWELPTESTPANEITDSSNRVKEFEEWKRSMRLGAASESSALETDVEFHGSSVFDNENIQQPGLSINVDSVFSDDISSSNKHPGVPVGVFGGKSSRFSKFFKPEADPRANIYPPAPPVPAPSEPNEADRNGFNRILAMLDGVQGNGQNDIQHQPQEEKGGSKDDAFFMSLLNKGGNEKPEPTSNSNQSSPSNSSAVQSPIAEKSRAGPLPNNEAAIVSPAQHHSQLPGIPFPPQEWLHAQANGQLPKIPPGMSIPPMMGNVPPGMLPFPPPPGMPNMPPGMPPNMMPNGMPMNVPPGMGPIPPHMMMGLPPGMPPFPPGAIPMGFMPGMEEMNGQFSPQRGLMPPIPGMHMPPFPGPPGLLSSGGVPPPGFPPNVRSGGPGGPPGLILRNEGRSNK